MDQEPNTKLKCIARYMNSLLSHVKDLIGPEGLVGQVRAVGCCKALMVPVMV